MPVSSELHQTELPTLSGSVRPVETAPGADRGISTTRLLTRIFETTDELERNRLRDEVVVLNMGAARAIALHYRDRGISKDDLMQAAYVGLVKAAQRFDPSYQRDFLSYAVPTVTGEVKRYF